MEIVDFDFYSYKPRIRVRMRLLLETVPVIGDYIHVPGKYLSEVSKKMKERDLLLQFGATFKVCKRLKYVDSPIDEDWRIDIVPEKEFEEASE
jgi:hypothetical protein